MGSFDSSLDNAGRGGDAPIKGGGGGCDISDGAVGFTGGGGGVMCAVCGIGEDDNSGGGGSGERRS